MNTGLVIYPLPLGGERFAFIYLPTVITKADVDRIIAILRTLEPDTEAQK